MLCTGHTYPLHVHPLLLFFLKFKFNWESCTFILSLATLAERLLIWGTETAEYRDAAHQGVVPSEAF